MDGVVGRGAGSGKGSGVVAITISSGVGGMTTGTITNSSTSIGSSLTDVDSAANVSNTVSKSESAVVAGSSTT